MPSGGGGGGFGGFGGGGGGDGAFSSLPTGSLLLASSAELSAAAAPGRFEEADGGTLVRLTGDLQINLQKLPGMPSFMAKRLVPEVERFILRLITPNLQRVNASLEEFLKQQG